MSEPMFTINGGEELFQDYINVAEKLREVVTCAERMNCIVQNDGVTISIRELMEWNKLAVSIYQRVADANKEFIQLVGKTIDHITGEHPDGR